MRRSLRFAHLTLLTVVAVGCDSLVPEAEVAAYISAGSARPVDLEAPDTVTQNIPFDVVIRPMLDCGSDAIPAIVQVTGLTADVTARALIPEHRESVSFTCEGRLKDRSVGTVTFSIPGAATLRIRGRDRLTGKAVSFNVPVFVKGM